MALPEKVLLSEPPRSKQTNTRQHLKIGATYKHVFISSFSLLCFFAWDRVFSALTGLELTLLTRLAQSSQSSACLCSSCNGMNDKQAALLLSCFPPPAKERARKAKTLPLKSSSPDVPTHRPSNWGVQGHLLLSCFLRSFHCPPLCYVAFWFVVVSAWLFVFFAGLGMKSSLWMARQGLINEWHPAPACSPSGVTWL